MIIEKIIGNRILIELPPKKDVTDAGIILTEPELPQIATVIKIGSDVKNIKEGDTVLFHKLRTFVKFEKDDKIYAIMSLDPEKNEVFATIN